MSTPLAAPLAAISKDDKLKICWRRRTITLSYHAACLASGSRRYIYISPQISLLSLNDIGGEDYNTILARADFLSPYRVTVPAWRMASMPFMIILNN